MQPPLSARPSPTSADDRALLDRLAQGDREAFDAIFRIHYPHLVAFGQGLLRDRSAAEDIAQDVLLDLWRRREDSRIQESVRAYLIRAVRNRSFNVLRHERVRRNAEPRLMGQDTVSAAGADRVAATELGAALAEALAELPPACRQVFDLSRVQGLRYAEIATTLGISIKTVESQMGKALKHLRLRLAEWLPEGRAL